MTPPTIDQGFDETTYLRLNPDVLVAVRAGKFSSGREHYEHYGRAEGRLALAPAALPRDCVMITARPGQIYETPAPVLGVMDQIKLSGSGGLFIAGWVNDSLDPLETIELYVAGWAIAFSACHLARIVRPDTDVVTKLETPHELGFYGFVYAAQRLPAGQCTVALRMKSGAELALISMIEPVDDAVLRESVLYYMGAMTYKGPQDFALAAMVSPFMGAQLVEFSRMLTRRAVVAPYVRRFHRAGQKVQVSVVICLEDDSAPLAVQLAAYAGQSEIQAYEFICVCAVPEIAEQVLATVQMAHLVHGLDITLVLLSAQASRAAAKNVGAGQARSARLLFVEAGVLPRGTMFAQNHLALCEAGQDLFGATLYPCSGNMPQTGLHFESETVPGLILGRKDDVSLLRLTNPQSVPSNRLVGAVGEAFLSVSTTVFAAQDGFLEDYAFGMFEGVDFCLRAYMAHRRTWVADLALDHMPLVKSTGKEVQRASKSMSRWLLTQNWLERARGGMRP